MYMIKRLNNELSKYASLMGKKGGNKTKSTRPANYYKMLGKYAMSIRWANHVKVEK